MISEEKLKILAEEGHPILLAGEERRQLLGLARELHKQSGFASGPFLIHRCGSRGLPEELHLNLLALCARLFNRGKGGTIYFENVDELSPEESKQLYMVLERGEYWDPEAEEFRPVDFRVVGSAPLHILDLGQATSLTYRLAERLIRIDPPKRS